MALLVIADPSDKCFRTTARSCWSARRRMAISENDLKALQSVGQIVSNVLKQLTEENSLLKLQMHQDMLVIVIDSLIKEAEARNKNCFG
ncbi:hypothetical protein AAY473_001911 [Plecturocebus cupreus]